MCKQIFFLLLFALALNAQQPQSYPESTDPASFVPDDAIPKLALRPDHPVEGSTLPNAPEPRLTGPRTGKEEDPLPAITYEPKRVKEKEPEPPITGAGVWNKKFIAVHAAFLGSIVYDAELTHQGLAHHNCVEANPNLGSHPSRAEIYRENVVAFGAINGLDWFAAKIKIRYLPYIGPVVGTVVHLTAGSKWLAQCW